MGTIDRYLLRGLALRFVAVVAIGIAILSLENVARLATDLQHTDAPLLLIARLSLLLMPEHLAIALAVAMLLATALTVRDLSLKGEWQMMAAAGMSPWRMARAPLLFALAVGGVQLADRLEWRPAAERGLDALFMDVHSGLHGTALVIGKPLQLDDKTMLFVSYAPASADGPLTGVLLKSGDDVASAPRASVRSAPGRGVMLDLQDGTMIHHVAGGGLRRLGFAHMAVRVDAPTIGLIAGNARHRLERLGAADLWRRATGAAGPADRASAMAAMIARVDDATFVLLLPLLGIVLGQPPRRSQSGLALLAGLVLVVVHLQTSAFVEDNLADAALLAGAIHIALWGAATLALMAFAVRNGEGAVEAALLKAVAFRLPMRRRAVNVPEAVQAPLPASVRALRRLPILAGHRDAPARELVLTA